MGPRGLGTHSAWRWRCSAALSRSGISGATEFSCCFGCRSRSTRFRIAYGSVPIYIPVWYPFSYYNVRYGLELLPVFAVFPAIAA